MRTAYEIVRRIAETAMSRHGLDQEQYFNLFVLGGAIELREVMK